MSFLGNIAAAQSAKAIGAYNQSLANQEAKMRKENADRNYKVFEQVTRPQLVEQYNSDLSRNFVTRLKQGVEMRGTPAIVRQQNRAKVLFNLAMADYNAKTNQTNEVNQSILIEARGAGEKFKGDLEARTQYIKAGASLLSMGQKSYQAKSLVIV